jgi:hypothetical protein
VVVAELAPLDLDVLAAVSGSAGVPAPRRWSPSRWWPPSSPPARRLGGGVVVVDPGLAELELHQLDRRRYRPGALVVKRWSWTWRHLLEEEATSKGATGCDRKGATRRDILQ